MIQQNSTNENTLPEINIQFIKAIRELKISTLLKQSNICKTSRSRNGGDGKKRTAFEIFQFLLMLVFEGTNLFRFLGSKKQDIACAKSTYYRFLSNCHYNWRRFILLLSGKAAAYFSTLTCPERVKCFVLDDSVIPRGRSKKVELLSFVHDHVIHKTVRGFNLLLLGWTDGYSFLPVAFNMLAPAKAGRRIVPINAAINKRTNGMEFDDDTSEMTEEALFDRHYKTLKKLHHDSLIILDNFNVLPKDDNFFREFAQNDFQLLITTRCHPTQYPIMELKELDTDTELPELFFRLCPSAKEDALATKKIIQTVHSHTLTVVLSALSLSASGMEAEELLYELQTCGLSISSGETVELYKDGDYTDGLMAEHLKKLLQLGKLSDSCLDVLRNLSLLSASGVLKNAFKNWLKLPSLNDVNYLAKYGFIHDDKENRKISLHPLIREIVTLETLPSVSNCHTLLNSLHCICLVHGLEVKRPQNVIDSLISITENILADIPEDYLLFLQDMFPYLEKYLVTDYLPKLVERIEYVMKQDTHSYCDRTLLLDYKAELFLIKNDYKNALKKRLKAVSILEPYHTVLIC